MVVVATIRHKSHNSKQFNWNEHSPWVVSRLVIRVELLLHQLSTSLLTDLKKEWEVIIKAEELNTEKLR